MLMFLGHTPVLLLQSEQLPYRGRGLVAGGAEGGGAEGAGAAAAAAARLPCRNLVDESGNIFGAA